MWSLERWVVYYVSFYVVIRSGLSFNPITDWALNGDDCLSIIPILVLTFHKASSDLPEGYS